MSTTDARDYDKLLEGARLIVRVGRSWLPLTADGIERGARCIVSDPVYRDELARSALRHSEECCQCRDLLGDVRSAYTALQLNRDATSGNSEDAA